IKIKKIQENDAGGENVKKIAKCRDLILDFHVRWNSTYLVIDRFIEHRNIISSITTTPTQIQGLRKKQYECLKTFEYSHYDWDILGAFHQTLGYVQRKQRAVLAPATLRYTMVLRDEGLLMKLNEH
ncbi:unnamed protein product, partial [Didymodactylos carnosus]